MTDPILDDPEKVAEITHGQRMHDREDDDSELIVPEIRRTSARMKFVDELEPAGVNTHIYPVDRLAPVEEAEEER